MVLDYRKDDLLHSLPHGPDVVKPNFAEFLDTFFPGQACVAPGSVSHSAAAPVSSSLLPGDGWTPPALSLRPSTAMRQRCGP